MTTTKYKERDQHGGELEIEIDRDGLASIEVTDSTYDYYTFEVDAFDQPMVALDLLGPGSTDIPTWTPPANASDDTLVMIARDALIALRERRAAAAEQEKERAEQIKLINERLEGRPLSLVQPLGPQLHALGFRLATIGGDA